ncbi:MAG: indolepyruvate oxidoreductase subunit beta family protein, partial [Alphaproteobacteria bacterium]
MDARPVSTGSDDQLLAASHPITIAVTAIGGQGGGVLAEWIVATAEREGWLAQSTSVPGVAQRTGATVYYIELFPRAEMEKAGREPVLALMPVPGDVDVAVAAEWMEAGRAIARGFVTPDRTVLIASTHRDYAIREKAAPGAGMEDDRTVWEAAQKAAKRLVAFDMRTIAARHGTVISAALFGAIAGAGVLPFQRESFEAAIRESGRGVEASLAAFAEAHEAAQRPPVAPDGERPARPVWPRASEEAPQLPAELASRIENEVPIPARATVMLGALRLIDYQGPGYAGQYLDRLARFTDGSAAVRDPAFYELLAKRLAVAMSYEDVYRVADL